MVSEKLKAVLTLTSEYPGEQVQHESSINLSIIRSQCGKYLFIFVYSFKMKRLKGTQSHLSSYNLLCDDFESIHNWDVAEPSGDGQSTVSILNENTWH